MKSRVLAGAGARASWVLALCALLAVMGWPSDLWACPSCAANQSDTSFIWILGSMILLPFPLAGLVTYVIRRADKDED